mmetsp:Transcript_33865/g.56848  ORF Transcript_33865/g.56848 Transcript_33865/m.56848 type:complete len:297 (-) Transcript_33865:474-1364(-)
MCRHSIAAYPVLGGHPAVACCPVGCPVGRHSTVGCCPVGCHTAVARRPADSTRHGRACHFACRRRYDDRRHGLRCLPWAAARGGCLKHRVPVLLHDALPGLLPPDARLFRHILHHILLLLLLLLLVGVLLLLVLLLQLLWHVLRILRLGLRLGGHILRLLRGVDARAHARCLPQDARRHHGRPEPVVDVHHGHARRAGVERREQRRQPAEEVGPGAPDARRNGHHGTLDHACDDAGQGAVHPRGNQHHVRIAHQMQLVKYAMQAPPHVWQQLHFAPHHIQRDHRFLGNGEVSGDRS